MELLSQAEMSETAEKRVGRLIAENLVIIIGRKSCCMCHVMKRLFSIIGVSPTVIELDDADMNDVVGTMLAPTVPDSDAVPPVVFIAGELIGGLESLVAMHLAGNLVPKLREVGALWD